MDPFNGMDAVWSSFPNDSHNRRFIISFSILEDKIVRVDIGYKKSQLTLTETL